jgi:hypothetical protein
MPTLSRFSRLYAPVVAVGLILSGCGEKWKIVRILVNPVPLAGAETVVPINLTANSQQTIAIEVTFQRDPGFTGSLTWRPEYTYPATAGGFNDTPGTASGWETASAFERPVTSDHVSAVVATVFCTHVQDSAGNTSVKLRAAGARGEAPSNSATGTTAANIRYIVDIVSHNNAGGYVSARAAEPLDITCLSVPLGLGSACGANPDCSSGYCDIGPGTANTKMCMPKGGTGKITDWCSHNSQCASSLCVGLHKDINSGAWQPGHCSDTKGLVGGVLQWQLRLRV